MAADLNLLIPDFAKLARALLSRCEAAGINMRPNEGIRDPFKQARYWRQSRSREEIEEKIADLRSHGAVFLAHCLDSVGPQHGDPVTNAFPGVSWHQWGVALDCFWRVDGRAEWSTTRLVNGKNGYRVYADEAEALGLTAGGHWRSFNDWPHVQLPAESSPLGRFTLIEIDQAMERQYGAA